MAFSMQLVVYLVKRPSHFLCKPFYQITARGIVIRMPKFFEPPLDSSSAPRTQPWVENQFHIMSCAYTAPKVSYKHIVFACAYTAPIGYGISTYRLVSILILMSGSYKIQIPKKIYFYEQLWGLVQIAEPYHEVSGRKYAKTYQLTKKSHSCNQIVYNLF